MLMMLAVMPKTTVAMVWETDDAIGGDILVSARLEDDWSV